MSTSSPILAPKSWPIVQLKDISLKIGSGATPRGGEETYLQTRSTFALVRSQNVFDRRFDATGLAFISDEQAARLSGVVLQPGDLLLNITGDGVTFSRACEVPAGILPACVNQHVAIIRVDPDLAVPGYVLAYLTHPLVKPYIESFNAGGSRRAITKGHIESFKVPLAPLPEQRAIAHILGTLDDKIELNRQMNQTLEQIAAALFRSWFIDFDPVRAKMAGREPEGMDAATATLLPERLVESEMGEIPEGWRAGTLGDISGAARQSSNPSRNPDQLFSHYSLPAFDAGRLPITEPGAAIKSNKLVVLTESVLVSKLNPHIPRVWLPGKRSEHPRIASTEFVVLEPTVSGYLPFLYAAVSSGEFVAGLQSMVTGTTGSHQRVPPRAIPAMPLVIPTAAVIKAFAAAAGPLYDRGHAAQRESVMLAALRDTLLPRLLSGEMRAPVAPLVAGAQGALGLAERDLRQVVGA